MSANELQVGSSGPQQTQGIARCIADFLNVGDLLVLTGDLGAGKTCFTQGLGAALGIDERITSPTFALANRYQGRLLLHHLDAYRLDTIGEAYDLDLPDLFESGVTVIEWGELLNPLLPENHLLVAIEYVAVDCSIEQDIVGPSSPGASLPDPSVPDTERLLRLVARGDRWAGAWDDITAALDPFAVGASPSKMEELS